MHSSRWLQIVALSFLGGVAIGSLSVHFSPILEIIMFGALVLMMVFFLRGQKNVVMGVISLVVLSAGLGVWRMESVLNRPNQYAELVGKNLDFEGQVTYVDRRVEQAFVNVKMDGKSSNVQFRLSPKTSVRYGDRVWVRGKIQLPKSSIDFDYEKFLKSRNVDAVGYYPKIVTLKSGEGNPVLSALISFKDFLSRQVSRVYKGDVLALVSGVLLGSKEGISSNLSDTFSSAGLSHILVASGFNLTVLVGSVSGLVYVLGRKRLQLAAAVLVFAFVGMTGGAAASILRAGIMALLLIISRIWGRQYSSGGAVILAASIMVLLNPHILLWDAGFQLSFAATCGIIFLTPVFDDFLSKFVQLNFLRENIAVSIAAVLSTLPIISFHFDRLQLLSLPSNLVVVPFVPVLMLLGFLGLLPVVGLPFSILATYLSLYILQVAERVSAIDVANVNLHFSFYGVVAYYILIITVYYRLLHKGNSLSKAAVDET